MDEEKQQPPPSPAASGGLSAPEVPGGDEEQEPIKKEEQPKKKKEMSEATTDEGNNNNEKQPTEQEEYDLSLEFLESRLLHCEHICGIPDRKATRANKIQTILVFQVYHKLLIFGRKVAFPMAIIVLLGNFAFVLFFSIHLMRNTCVPGMSLVDGDLPDFAYQLTYRDSNNVFLCTTGYNNLILNDNDNNNNNGTDSPSSSSCGFWTPCTLRGLDSSTYDLKNSICPESYNGCYRDPTCLPDDNDSDVGSSATSNDDDDDDKGYTNLINVCTDETSDQEQQEEIICQGVVSVTYYSCPNAGTVIGAALGYSGLVQIAVCVVVVLFYVAGKALFGGGGVQNTFRDVFTAAFSPAGMTTDQAASSRTASTSANKETSTNNNNKNDIDNDERDEENAMPHRHDGD